MKPLQDSNCQFWQN